jgi:twitching motility protein PilT
VVSQRLVPRADGKGRVAAVEVLRATARVRELIEDKDRTKEIHDAIAQGFDTYGMQTFDQSLMSLVRQGLVTYEEAHRQATNPDDFALRFSGISGTSDSKWDNFEGGGSRPMPGSSNFGQQNQQQAAAPRPAAAPAPAAPAQRTTSRTAVPAVGAQRPAASSPQARPTASTPAAKPPPAPASGGGGGGDDDFQIERF